MGNALEMNLCPLPAAKYCKSTKQFTRQPHQANKGNSGLEAEQVRALGALCSIQSKKKLSVEKRWETHLWSNAEKEHWIEDYVERETAVARQRIQYAETAIIEEQEDMRNVENACSTTTKPETTFGEILNEIWDSLSDLASSDNENNREDEDDEEDTELGMMSEDDEPGWEMGWISRMVQHGMESFRQKQMRLHELTTPAWGDAADYFRQSDMKYGMTELKVPAAVKPKTDTTVPTSSPTSFGELMQTLHIVPRQSQMPQVTSRPGISQIRLRSEQGQVHSQIAHLMPDVLPDSSQM